MNRQEKAKCFARLHVKGAPLLLYNAWDAGSARLAESLGAAMEVWSESGAGTEVQLNIPAAIAYQEPIRRDRLPFFRGKRRSTP